MNILKQSLLLSILALLALLSACGDDEGTTPDINTPFSYEFTRNGESTVSFSGQTERLNMLSEIKSYVQQGDAGNALDASVLNDMYANEGEPFESAELNASTKQLESKTFLADVSFFKDLFASAEATSIDFVANGAVATQGTAGRIERGTSGKFILVNEKGWEYTQMIEKGLMGAVFYHQIFNVYLTDDRIGPDVDNVNLVDGKNYTAKEHHFDEAFGYWGYPVDFPETLPAEDDRFWAAYSFDREPLINSVTNLKNAFLRGRTAIVQRDQQGLEIQVENLYEEFELLTAATAMHYINESIADINSNDQGNLLHHASEAYMFIRALKYSPVKVISDTQLTTLLDNHLGTDGDFWTISLSGLNEAKELLGTVYPALGSVADEL